MASLTFGETVSRYASSEDLASNQTPGAAIASVPVRSTREHTCRNRGQRKSRGRWRRDRWAQSDRPQPDPQPQCADTISASSRTAIDLNADVVVLMKMLLMRARSPGLAAGPRGPSTAAVPSRWGCGPVFELQSSLAHGKSSECRPARH